MGFSSRVIISLRKFWCLFRTRWRPQPRCVWEPHHKAWPQRRTHRLASPSSGGATDPDFERFRTQRLAQRRALGSRIAPPEKPLKKKRRRRRRRRQPSESGALFFGASLSEKEQIRRSSYRRTS